MIAIIDNYDSFVYNLARYFRRYSEVTVFRNDSISIENLHALQPKGIIISPGPCTPYEAGISMSVIQKLAPIIPILGVCLGHQCIGAVYGYRIVRAPKIIHGKTSPVVLNDNKSNLFKDLPDTFKVMRYHSLIVKSCDTTESELLTTATLDGDETIMAIQHKRAPLFGVQFHPESILTEHGSKIIFNFLQIVNRFWSIN